MRKSILLILMICVLSTMVFADLDDGLYSYIKFENISLIDEYGYANDWGVMNSSESNTPPNVQPTFEIGKLGNAINIAPDTEQIVVYYGSGDPLSPDNIYESQWKHNGGTFNVWFNIDSFTTSMQYGNNWGYIYGGRQEDGNGCINSEPMGVSLSIGDVGLQETAYIHFISWDPDWPASGVQFNNVMLGELQTDTWYMATTTYDVTSHIVKLYINGVEEASASYTPSETGKDNYCSWYFGNGPNNGITGGNNYAFPGLIDAFKAFNRPLSGTEVLNLYTAENAGIDVPYCTPDWSCTETVCLNHPRHTECRAVVDVNECGDSYSGDYSEFYTEGCISEETEDNTNNAFIVQQNLAKQSAASQPTGILGAINQFVMNLRASILGIFGMK